MGASSAIINNKMDMISFMYIVNRLRNLLNTSIILVNAIIKSIVGMTSLEVDIKMAMNIKI